MAFPAQLKVDLTRPAWFKAAKFRRLCRMIVILAGKD